MKSIALSSLGSDAVLETEHLENHGASDGLAVGGHPVHLYGVQSDNENSYGRRFGGPAFFAFGGGVGCLHA